MGIIKYKLLLIKVFAVFLISCSSGVMNTKDIQNLYVDDFYSDEPAVCKTTDVDLSHSQALQFFKRARVVEYRKIHQHYDLAPCYIEGPLIHKEEPCEWEIRAGATGSITCKDKKWYFVCDDCDDLFESQQ